MVLRQSSNALLDSSYSQLTAIREIKKSQIENYFAERKGDLQILVNTVAVQRQEIETELKTINEGNNSRLSEYLGTSGADSSFSEYAERVLNEFHTGLGASGRNELLERRNGRTRYLVGDGSVSSLSEPAALALDGESGAGIFLDESGTPIITVYSSLSAGTTDLALLTSISLSEALVTGVDGHREDFFTEYVREYGYYDLFLIHGDGLIFFSVAGERDMSTNILDGPYSNSNLAQAVKAALNSKGFSFADFKPYEPSRGAPASFIVQPLESRGDTDLLVALQMPLDRVNAIMQERTGMGETGESYLVGPDRLMRSDSFLDPVNHSVAASFARPDTGSVETTAVLDALSGASGIGIHMDYNGNPVLSSYTNLDVFGTNWALLSEIDEAEVQKPVKALMWFIIIISAVLVFVASAVAVLYSLSISKPIMLLVQGAGDLAMGDIELSNVNEKAFKAILRRPDELGVIGRSFSRLVEYQRAKAHIAMSIAQNNLDVDVNSASAQDTLGQSFQRMTASLNDVLGKVNRTVEGVSAGADQVSRASQSLSQGATEQAASVEQISASVNQIRGQSDENAEKSIDAATIAQEVMDRARNGNEQMNRMVESIGRINESSEQINNIVKVIDDIAFQINILALNANVEAARAGKYGKGFAVVAEEVRNLATRSAQAAQETSAMVEDSRSNIEEGTEIARQTAESLNEIVNGIDTIAVGLSEISTASEEQARGVSEVTKGLEQIEDVTQNTSANAEEGASASEELSAQARELKSMISDFRLRDVKKTATAKAVQPDPVHKEARSVSPAPPEIRRPVAMVALDDDDFANF